MNGTQVNGRSAPFSPVPELFSISSLNALTTAKASAQWSSGSTLRSGSCSRMPLCLHGATLFRWCSDVDEQKPARLDAILQPGTTVRLAAAFYGPTDCDVRVIKLMDHQEKVVMRKLTWLSMPLFGLALMIVAGVSFVATLLLMPDRPTRVDVATLVSIVERLDKCAQSGNQTTPPCQTDAGMLISALAGVKPSQFDFHRTGHFDVFVMRANLVAVRKSCTSRDTEADEFHYRVWPADKTELTDVTKQQGYFAATRYFSKIGVRYNNICIIVQRAPFSIIETIDIGQYDRPTKKWLWRVEQKI